MAAAAAVTCALSVPTFALAGPAPGTAGDLPRVVSINLCADQLLLELAAPGQILSLTRLSQDPAASHHVEAAAAFEANAGDAEVVLSLAPDAVIAGDFTNRYTFALLESSGLEVHRLPIANSVRQVLDNLLLVGEWIGRGDLARTRVAALEARLNALSETVADELGTPDEITEHATHEMAQETGEPDEHNNELDDEPTAGHSAAPSRRPSAAIYDPNGYTVGLESLRGEMLERAGFHNVATDAGITGYGSLPLESLVRFAPDVIIDSPYSAGTWSRAQALAEHPALRARGVDPVVITLASADTICGGPWVVDLIERLHDARRSIEASRRAATHRDER